MSKSLVIVESPNKIRSIAGYLGPEFDVEASVGTVSAGEAVPHPASTKASRSAAARRKNFFICNPAFELFIRKSYQHSVLRRVRVSY